MQILVRDREADAVLPQLREHASHGERREALELVDVDEEVAQYLERGNGWWLIPLTQVTLDVVCCEVGRVRSPGRTPDS